jgi:hypothetical protein
MRLFTPLQHPLAVSPIIRPINMDLKLSPLAPIESHRPNNIDATGAILEERGLPTRIFTACVSPPVIAVRRAKVISKLTIIFVKLKIRLLAS